MSNFLLCDCSSPFRQGICVQIVVFLIVIGIACISAQPITPINIFQGLNDPRGIAVFTSGGNTNVYIADTRNNRIVKFDSQGMQQELTVTSKSLNLPYGIAVDKTGNVYVADTVNRRIVKFNSRGIEVQAFVNSPTLRNPFSIVVDTGGNLYVADVNSNQIIIVKLDPTGIQQTFVTNVTVKNVPSVAVDSTGNIYVSDTTGDQIIKLNSTGHRQTFNTSLKNPLSISVDSNDNLYVLDSGIIVKLNSIGIQQDFNSTLLLNNSRSITVDTTTEGTNIYVTTGNGAAFKISPQGVQVQVFASVFPVLFAPTGLAVDGTGNMYIIHRNGEEMLKLNASGIIQQKNTLSPGSYDVTIDSSGLHLYISDTIKHQVLKLNLTGDQQKVFISTDLPLSVPRGVAVDVSGNLYMVDSNNSRIVKFNSEGNQLQAFSTPGVLSNLYGIAIDSTGNNIYVTDTDNDRILKFNSSGVRQVFNSISLSLIGPKGIAVDSSGDIFIGDYANGRVIQVNASGVLQRVFTTTPVPLSPISVTVDNSGKLYVVDNNHNRIVVFNITSTPTTPSTTSPPTTPSTTSPPTSSPPTPTSKPQGGSGSTLSISGSAFLWIAVTYFL